MQTDRHVFEGVQNFKNVRTRIDSKNEMIEEMKPRGAEGNRHYFSLKHKLGSRTMNKRVQIQT
jgi:hypothetical protein